MKAIAHTGSDIASLTDIELPTPSPAGRDLLVKVEAVSVNPVDTKQRKAALRAHRVDGGGEIARGIGERAVEVEQHCPSHARSAGGS